MLLLCYEQMKASHAMVKLRNVFLVVIEDKIKSICVLLCWLISPYMSFSVKDQRIMK